MSVGGQVSSATIDSALTDLAVTLRNVLQKAANLNEFVNGQGTGTATLEAMGYSAGDAATALQMIGYLTTMSQVFTGAATQGTTFNFNNALSVLWAGQ